MMTDTLFFFIGVLLFVCGPFLAVYTYQEGSADGPTCFAFGMILFGVSIGLISGFAA